MDSGNPFPESLETATMSVTQALPNLPTIDRGPSVDPKAPTPERIKALAAQFESMLVGQMMQQMRSSMFDSEDADAEKGAAPLADALFSELSLALSRAGGLGLADSLVAPLGRETGAVGVVSSGAAATPADVAAAGADAIADLPAPFVSGRMSSAYGWRRDPIDQSVKFHRGVDIAMPVGNDVPAAQTGTVKFAGEAKGYGLTVVIDHGSYSTRYAHLSKLDVQPGDRVQAGQIIAQSGATGRVTGAHLHFEVIEAGQSVNPSEILPTYAAGGSH
jgi:murein DD-endopeptidase MepM/ murein hydrolase activator NlpD